MQLTTNKSARSRSYSVLGTEMVVTSVGDDSVLLPHVIWGHGWGQSSTALLPLAETLAPFACSSLLDFPGFGASPLPSEVWGTATYAKAVAEYMEATQQRDCIWVGHSFGCRVGLQLASTYPELVRGLILVAAAGIPPRRSLSKRVRRQVQPRLFRAAKHILPKEYVEQLRNQLGSRDYASAGPLRPILTRVVNEDLTEAAQKISCATLLVYGRDDTETPVEMGERFNHLIRNSELIVLDNFNHNSIISEGSHQLANIIRQFVAKVSH